MTKQQLLVPKTKLGSIIFRKASFWLREIEGAISKSNHIHYKRDKKEISEEQYNHLKCSKKDGF